MTAKEFCPRLEGESLKSWKKRIGEARSQIAADKRREARRQRGLYRRAELVYEEIDRSPDSDPYDVESPQF